MKDRYLEDLSQWIRETTEHSLRVEYYINKLEIIGTDPERPHDIVGVGNKFEREVAIGMITLFTKKNNRDLEYAIRIHRGQYHHRVWGIHRANYNHPDISIAVIDAVCSHIENRGYQTSSDHWDRIETDLYEKRGRIRERFHEVIAQMKRVSIPKIEIKNLDDIKNPGIPEEMFNILRRRVNEARSELEIL